MSVKENLKKSRIHSFLKDITKLCDKHCASIYTEEVAGRLTTVLDFTNWEKFSELEADQYSSSVYWPRVESHIMHEEKP